MYNAGKGNQNKCYKSNELAEKLAVCVKDNEKLAKMMGDLRLENEELNKTLRNRSSGCSDSRSGMTRDEKGYKETFEAMVEINHGWKKDYEELQIWYEMLKAEKRLLEDEKRDLNIRINDLEKRHGPLESKLARLAAALSAQQGSSNGSPSEDEEQCEILKSQITSYKEDLERKRKDREKIHEEKEKFKSELQDAEDIIRKLTAELDACKAREEAHQRSWSESGHLSERVASPQRYSYHPVGQGWRQEQERKGILPGNYSPKVAQHLKNCITIIL